MGQDGGGYPLVLNGDGCKFGRRLERKLDDDMEAEKEARSKEVEALQTSINELGKRLDRLMWALVSAAVGFGSMALALGLNLVLAGKV